MSAPTSRFAALFNDDAPKDRGFVFKSNVANKPTLPDKGSIAKGQVPPSPPPRSRSRKNSGGSKRRSTSPRSLNTIMDNMVVPVPTATLTKKALPVELQHPNWMNLPLCELIRPDVVDNIERIAKTNPEDTRLVYLVDLFKTLRPCDL